MPADQKLLSSLDEGQTALFRQHLQAEYGALRDEMLKRIELQHQYHAIAITAIGVFLTLGYTNSVTLLLTYPMLALFLTFAWGQSARRIRQIGGYIREKIEPYFMPDGLGWEHARAEAGRGRIGYLSLLAARGIYLGTQILAILAAYLIAGTRFEFQDIILFILDPLVLLLTLYLLRSQAVSSEDMRY